MKSKCKVCKINEAIWAWQPFGPNESYDLFMFLGHHYRTFAVIKICDDCSEKVKRSLPPTSTPFRFEYDATRLVALNGEIVKDTPALAAPESDDTPERTGYAGTVLTEIPADSDYALDTAELEEEARINELEMWRGPRPDFKY